MLVVLAVVALFIPFCAPLVIAIFVLSVSPSRSTPPSTPRSAEPGDRRDGRPRRRPVVAPPASCSAPPVALKAFNALRAVRAGHRHPPGQRQHRPGAASVIFRQETSLANLVRQGRGLVPTRFPLGTRTDPLTAFQVVQVRQRRLPAAVPQPDDDGRLLGEDYVDAVDTSNPGPSTLAIQNAARRDRFGSSPWSSPPWDQQQLIVRAA